MDDSISDTAFLQKMKKKRKKKLDFVFVKISTLFFMVA